MAKYPVTGRKWFYSFVRALVVPTLYFFYRKYRFVGMKNIPKNKPVIYAINHQNAVLDSVVLVPSNVFTQFSSMTRASIFKNPLVRRIVYGMNLIPVYRQQDGVNTIESNDPVFDNCVYLLENKKPIVIFPEGMHNNKRSIRQAKKGLARIVFQAEDKHDFNLDVQIIPVGVNYSDPYNFGSDVLVKFGEAIPVSRYKESYKENAARAMNELRLEVDTQMRALAIDIQALDQYDEIEMTRTILINEKSGGRMNDPEEELSEAKRIIPILEKATDGEWVEKAKEYEGLLKQMRIRDYMMVPSYKLKHTWLFMLLFVLGAPLFLAGAAVNILPFFLPVWITRKLVRDITFRSTLMLVFGMLIFIVYYLIIMSVMAALVSWSVAGMVALGGFTSGVFALFYVRKWKKFSAWNRLQSLKKKQDTTWAKASALRQDIVEAFTG